MDGPSVLAFSPVSDKFSSLFNMHRAGSHRLLVILLSFPPMSQEHWDYCTGLYVHPGNFDWGCNVCMGISPSPQPELKEI